MLPTTPDRPDQPQQQQLPPAIFVRTRLCWGDRDYQKGLDWAIMRIARGPSTKAIDQATGAE